MLFRIGMACESEIVQPQGKSWHENRGIPRGSHESWVALELSDALTREFFARPKSNPRWSAEMKPPSWDTSVFVPNSSRIAALIAPGWSRRRAPPFPFSLLPLPLLPQPPKLQADSKSSKTTLPKKCLPKVIGKGPITKNAIYARTTRPHHT